MMHRKSSVRQDALRPTRTAITPVIEALEHRMLLSAGDLDPSFGTGGKVTTDLLGDFVGGFRQVAVQGDGKIVGIGTTRGVNNNFAVARFNSDGTLDTGFGSDGVSVADFDGGDDRAHAVAIQPDGKIVVTGRTSFGVTGKVIALARFDNDGSLDSSFGVGGTVVTVPTSTSPDVEANAVAVHPDGRIVVAGTHGSTFAGSAQLALARYNADGSLDASFGLQIYGHQFGETRAQALAIQPDGKYVTAGNGGLGRLLVARFESNGEPDAGFPTAGGVSYTPFTNVLSQASSLAIGPGGEIILAGQTNAADRDFAVVRLLPNGLPDTSFDGDGLATTQLGTTFDSAMGVALQADGKIIAVGHTGDAFGGMYLAAARYNADGSLDSSFDGDGKATYPLLGAGRMALQADGKILAAAGGVTRITSSGGIDSGFGSGGSATTTFPGSLNDTARQVVARQSDGKLIVVGFGTADGLDVVALARYNVDGSLDQTFGSGGIVTSDFGFNEIARGIVLQPDGKIVLGGSANADFLVARYNDDGTLDPTFGVGGWVTSDFAGFLDGIFSIALQPDGKIVAAGQAGTLATGTDFGLARYNADGSPDTSFDGDGLLTTAFGTGFDTDIAAGLVIAPDGKIIAAGQAFVPGFGNDFGLARYHPDGTLDASFGAGGLVTTTFTPSSDFISGLALQPDGRIVAAGTAFVAGTGNIVALARYDEDGTLDTSFDSDGMVTTNFPGTGDVARAVALQPNGRIIAAGAAGGNFALARYDATGALDASFGAGGLVTTDFGGSGDSAFGLALQPDGKIVAAGVTNAPGLPGMNFAIARYLGDNQPPTAQANGPYSVSEGGTVPLSALGSSDPEQDASTLVYEWDLDGDNIFGETGVAAAHGDETGASPTFSAAGINGPASLIVTLRVTDSFGAQSMDTAQVDVTNADPSVGPIVAPLDPTLVGTTINASAQFTDAGIFDTHTAIWHWGDASVSVGTVTEANGAGGVTGSHVYEQAGVYTVTLVLADGDGGQAQSLFQYIVIYNPADGFVTGGGTFDSPAGALNSDLTASGIAQFAFVSKYQHGATVPDGQTNFRFNAGSFQFESDSYEWMVISGAKARYRGVGSVNGVAGFGFQITVIDGQAPGGGGQDRFRIRIWNVSTNAAVYDNQLGAPDHDDPLTALRGGSIRIQS